MPDDSFSKPSPIEQLGLIDYIMQSLSDARLHSEKLDLGRIARDIYMAKLHNGIRAVGTDKCRLIASYRDYLREHGLSAEQFVFISPIFPNEDYHAISSTAAGYLWCEFPTPHESYAADYENRLYQGIYQVLKQSLETAPVTSC
jgi:hypothetical protein